MFLKKKNTYGLAVPKLSTTELFIDPQHSLDTKPLQKHDKVSKKLYKNVRVYRLSLLSVLITFWIKVHSSYCITGKLGN